MNKGILLISTRKYKQFVQDLINQIDKYFLPGHEKTIFVFTDLPQTLKSENHIQQIRIPDYKFPYATLYRYKMFAENEEKLKQCSHLYYLDVDMAIVSKIDTDILVDGLMVVRHPGFYVSDGWGDNNNPVQSTSFMPADRRKHYYCGGVQGGKAEAYLEMSKTLAANIDEDDKNGIIAEWNDETHYNKYVNWAKPDDVSITEFTPSYCMVEEMPLRQRWGIADLEVKIIALAKNHAEIRS